MRHEFVTEDIERCLTAWQKSAEGVVVAEATKARTIGRVSSAWVSMWVLHWPSCFGRPWVGTTR